MHVSTLTGASLPHVYPSTQLLRGSGLFLCRAVPFCSPPHAGDAEHIQDLADLFLTPGLDIERFEPTVLSTNMWSKRSFASLRFIVEGGSRSTGQEY